MWQSAECSHRGCLPLRDPLCSLAWPQSFRGCKGTQEGGSGERGVRGRLGEEYVDEMQITPVLGGALVSPQGL